MHETDAEPAMQVPEVKLGVLFPSHVEGHDELAYRRYIVLDDEVIGFVDRDETAGHYVTLHSRVSEPVVRKEFDSMMAAREFVYRLFDTE